jgi:tripartite-type tricarboxylate transporter receptor subunit TctC
MPRRSTSSVRLAVPLRAIVIALVTGALAQSALAQTWPARSLRIVVPFAAGGATDAVARTLGQALGETLGQTVVIDNRAGAAGALGADLVAKAPADGYTLLMATTSTHAVLPVLQPKLPYDAMRDFALVTLVARAPNVLIAGPGLPANNVAELIALARAKPDTLNFASSGTGTITHLIGELFKTQAGIRVTHVPYKSGVQSVPDVMSGQVAYLFDSIVWSLPQIKAGKLKGLAITSSKRSALAPDLPTVAEQGLPGFEGTTWLAIVAPAGTPADVVNRLQSEIARHIASPDVRQKLATQGAEAESSTPAELAALIRSDMARWGKVIREAGVKAE